jgi:hypothetical protein
LGERNANLMQLDVIHGDEIQVVIADRPRRARHSTTTGSTEDEEVKSEYSA